MMDGRLRVEPAVLALKTAVNAAIDANSLLTGAMG
jgi:hypothetical protein